MSHKELDLFQDKAQDKASDTVFKKKLQYNITQYDNTVIKGKNQYADLELARRKAKNIKWKAIENMDKMLLDFESNFQKRGGKVIWATDAAEALTEILRICQSVQCKSVVKSKSMTTEEIHLNAFLEKNGIESVETDLGEYIQQLDGEPPFHIVTPAMHKSKEDCARVFETKLGEPAHLTPQEMTMIARRNLRAKYRQAEVGISGANFIIADTGAICVTENEGNARLTTTFPKTHIVIVGIEKILPSLQDLHHFWPLLATFGTGQNVTTYNTIFTGAKQENEIDGPEQMYVILLDNGRSSLLAQPQQREALYCIRCGACLNACPVYKNIGGHTYHTTYSGPIGSVISPHYQGMQDFKHLSYASSLCGACTEVCPMHINIHNMLLYNRRDSVQQTSNSFSENMTWKIYRSVMLKRKNMNRGGAYLKNKMLRLLFKNKWGDQRQMLQVSPQSFQQWWLQNREKSSQ